MDRFIVTVSLSLFALTWAATPASAQTAEEEQHEQAQKLVEGGLKDARAKRFDSAVQQFDAALKLFPHPEIAHNLARAQQELGNHIEAIGAFKRALDMDASYTFADDARKRITALDFEIRKNHGVLTVTSTPDAVAITILVRGATFAGHLVSPVTQYVPAGTFAIKGSKSGFMSGDQAGEIAAGAELTVELLLRPIPKKGFLTVTADVQGAEVLLDGKSVGVTPLEGYAVAAGQHMVRISAEGRQSFEVSVNVAPNSEERVSATLPVLVTAVEDGAGESYGLLGGILLGSGVGVSVIATSLWIFAVNKAEDADNAPYTPASSGVPENAEYYELVSSAEALEAGAWVSAVAAVGLIVGGTWLLLISPDDADVDADAAVWTPVIAPTDGGLGVGAAVRF